MWRRFASLLPRGYDFLLRLGVSLILALGMQFSVFNKINYADNYDFHKISEVITHISIYLPYYFRLHAWNSRFLW